MKSVRISTLVCLAGVLAFLASTRNSGGQENSGPHLVSIEGLKPAYGSCSLVTFSIRNTSQRQIDYLEVYLEDLKAGAWDDVICPYDINHPKSRHAKLRMIPSAMKPGESISLSYDRCLAYQRCEWDKLSKDSKQGSELALKQLKQQDTKATPAVQQRIRVEVHVLEQEHFKLAGKEWSQPFTRTAEK